jgi:hypothetical protein
MPMTRRSLLKLAAAAPFFATRPVLGAQLAADDSLRSKIRLSAGLLGLPGCLCASQSLREPPSAR